MGRTDVQCREKWNNNLDPTVNNNKFSEDEDQVLQQLVDRCGEGNWSLIAEYMPGRTDAMVRSRWNSLQKSSSTHPKAKNKDISSVGKRKALPSKHLR